MKNLFRNYFILSFFATLFVVVACKKDEVLTPAKSSDKSMSSFAFGSLSPAVSATITGTTVAAMVPFNVDVTSLAPTISVAAKATVSPASGTAQNFTNAVTYTVTAEDGTTAAYSVTVTKGKNPAKDILTFAFAALSPAVVTTIDATAKTITATVSESVDITKLVPTITLSDKATVSPATGVAQDFSKEVIYSVTAEDGTKQDYKVKIIVFQVCRVVAYDISSSDGGTNKYTVTYNDKGQMISENGGERTYTYDSNDFLTIEKYSVQVGYSYTQNTTYNYQNGRLVSTRIDGSYNGAPFSQANFQTYSYDSNGNLISYSKDNVTWNILNGKITSITEAGFTNVINSNGFIASRKSSASTSKEATLYTYDANGQQTLVENYDVKGLKTSYTTTEYTTTKTAKALINPLGFKGHPTLPSNKGIELFFPKKVASYNIDANGKETKSFEYTYSFTVDSNGNLVSLIFNNLDVIANQSSKTTANYTYKGCK